MKKFVITMMLTLIWQIASSQTVSIDTISKTITLSREKKIDVAKIILNEKDLFEENKLLKEYVLGLEKENKELEEKLKISNNEVSSLKDKIISKQDEIIKDYTEIDKVESKNSNNGFYVNTNYITKEIGIGAGITFVSNKMFYSVSYFPNTIIQNQKINPFQISIGFKLF